MSTTQQVNALTRQAHQHEREAAEMLGLRQAPMQAWQRGHKAPRTLWLEDLRAVAPAHPAASEQLAHAHDLYWQVVELSTRWMARRLGSGETPERLQHLREAAFHAAELYDPSLGVDWFTYLHKWVVAHIQKRVCEEVLPMLPVALYRKRRAVLESLPSHPTDEDFVRVAKEHKVGVGSIRRIFMAAPMDSMDRPLFEADGPTLGDQMAAPVMGVEALSAHLDVQRILARLDIRGAYVLVRYHGLLGTTPLFFDDIGADLGVSRSAIQQRYRSVMRLIHDGGTARDPVGEEGLQGLVAAAIYLDGHSLAGFAEAVGLTTAEARRLAQKVARDLLGRWNGRKHKRRARRSEAA